MPDKRKHRGAHPSDAKLFADDQLPVLRDAVYDLAWLLDRGYTENASVRFVGNRYRLKDRQRQAVWRIACSRQKSIERLAKMLRPESIAGKIVEIDGFNLIIIIESALSGGFVFLALDGVIKDIAGLHANYRQVLETEEAIRLVGESLQQLEVAKVRWLIDRPVSNSGRLKALMSEMAETNGWNWEVELVFSPDAMLKRSRNVVVSSDGPVLDEAVAWFNLSRYLINNYIPQARLLKL